MRPATSARSAQVCGFGSHDLAYPSDVPNCGEIRETQTPANFATGWISLLCLLESAFLLFRLPCSSLMPPAIQPGVSVGLVFRHLECLYSTSIECVCRAHAKCCQRHPAGTHDTERKVYPHDSRYRGLPMCDSGVRESFSPLPEVAEILDPTNTLGAVRGSIVAGPPHPFDGSFDAPGSTTGRGATRHDREPLLGPSTPTTVIRLLRPRRPYNPRNQPPCGPCHVPQRIQGSTCGERRAFANYLCMSDLRGNEVLNDTGNARLRGK